MLLESWWEFCSFVACLQNSANSSQLQLGPFLLIIFFISIRTGFYSCQLASQSATFANSRLMGKFRETSSTTAASNASDPKLIESLASVKRTGKKGVLADGDHACTFAQLNYCGSHTRCSGACLAALLPGSARRPRGAKHAGLCRTL